MPQCCSPAPTEATSLGMASMQVSELLYRLERTRAPTCGAATDQRSSKMTLLPTAGSRDAKIRLVSYRREAYEPKSRSYEDAVLAHDDDDGRCPFWIIRVTLSARPSLPVLPDWPVLQSRLWFPQVVTWAVECPRWSFTTGPRQRWVLPMSPMPRKRKSLRAFAVRAMAR
jgi:hypothetical protein